MQGVLRASLASASVGAQRSHIRGQQAAPGIATEKRDEFAVTRWPASFGPCSPSLEGMRDASYARTWRRRWIAQPRHLLSQMTSLGILIPTAWLALLWLCVGLCRAAARGDAVVVSRRAEQPRPRDRRVRRTVHLGPSPLRPLSRPDGRVRERRGFAGARHSPGSEATVTTLPRRRQAWRTTHPSWDVSRCFRHA
jgi:hypothetical protein